MNTQYMILKVHYRGETAEKEQKDLLWKLNEGWKVVSSDTVMNDVVAYVLSKPAVPKP